MKIRKPGINLTWFTTSRFVLGTDEKKNEFRIYPNPTQRIVHLILPDNVNGLVNFNIKSLEGKLIRKVEEEQSSNGMLSLDISNLKQGIYIIEVFSNDQLRHGSGGPRNKNALYSIEEIAEYYKNFDFIELTEKQIELKESKSHWGPATVIRLYGIKK